MDDRDKIIREDYPADRLPEDLRAELGDVTRVRVTVERTAEAPEAPEAASERKHLAWNEIKALIEKARASPGFRPVTTEEAAARVRALRDEWDR